MILCHFRLSVQMKDIFKRSPEPCSHNFLKRQLYPVSLENMVQRFQCIQIVFCSPSSPTKLSMATSLSRCTPVIDFPRGSSRRHFSRFILWLQVLPLRVPPSSIFFFWLCKIHCLPSLELPKHWNFCRVHLLLAKCISILKSSPVRVKLHLLLHNSDPISIPHKYMLPVSDVRRHVGHTSLLYPIRLLTLLLRSNVVSVWLSGETRCTVRKPAPARLTQQS